MVYSAAKNLCKKIRQRITKIFSVDIRAVTALFSQLILQLKIPGGRKNLVSKNFALKNLFFLSFLTLQLPGGGRGCTEETRFFRVADTSCD